MALHIHNKRFYRTGKWRPPGIRRKARAKYKLLIGPLRKVAKECGYALGVHGSLDRDIDLIACPWTKEALTPQWLIKRILKVVHRLCRPKREGYYLERGTLLLPEKRRRFKKPHGRVCWAIHLGDGPYLDISVMPRK